MNDLIAISEFVGTAVWQVWPLFLISILLSVLIRALKLDGVIRRAFQLARPYVPQHQFPVIDPGPGRGLRFLPACITLPRIAAIPPAPG